MPVYRRFEISQPNRPLLAPPGDVLLVQVGGLIRADRRPAAISHTLSTLMVGPLLPSVIAPRPAPGEPTGGGHR